MLRPKQVTDDCFSQAASLATSIISSGKSIRDSVYLHQVGRIPRKTMEERLEDMSEDEKYAVELIGKIGAEHEGLFADFHPPETRTKPRPVAPPTTEPKIKLPSSPKISKKEFRAAKNLADCIVHETGAKTDWSEPGINRATALCLCGERI